VVVSIDTRAEGGEALASAGNSLLFGAAQASSVQEPVTAGGSK
jgi:hypothetical protein